MRTYAVTITATVTKTYTVEAASKDEALSLAHESFSVVHDGAPERYEEETVDVKELEEA